MESITGGDANKCVSTYNTSSLDSANQSNIRVGMNMEFPNEMECVNGDQEISGDCIPDKNEKPFEMIVFKIRQKKVPSSLGVGICSSEHCHCEYESVRDNIIEFCSAVIKLAECRSRMCPNTLETVLNNEDFGLQFQWLELGEESESEEDEIKQCGSISTESESNNPADENQINENSTQANNVNCNESLSTPLGTRNEAYSELPDVSSTTPGGRDLANINSFPDSSTAENLKLDNKILAPAPTSSTKEPSTTRSIITAGLILKGSTAGTFQQEVETSIATRSCNKSSPATIDKAVPVICSVEGSTAFETSEDVSTSDYQPKTVLTESSSALSETETLSMISNTDAVAAESTVPNLPSASGECISASNSSNNDGGNKLVKENEHIKSSRIADNNLTTSTERRVDSDLPKTAHDREYRISIPSKTLSSTQATSKQKLRTNAEPLESDPNPSTSSAASYEKVGVILTSMSVFEASGGAARVNARLRSIDNKEATIDTSSERTVPARPSKVKTKRDANKVGRVSTSEAHAVISDSIQGTNQEAEVNNLPPIVPSEPSNFVTNPENEVGLQAEVNSGSSLITSCSSTPVSNSEEHSEQQAQVDNRQSMIISETPLSDDRLGEKIQQPGVDNSRLPIAHSAETPATMAPEKERESQIQASKDGGLAAEPATQVSCAEQQQEQQNVLQAEIDEEMEEGEINEEENAPDKLQENENEKINTNPLHKQHSSGISAETKQGQLKDAANTPHSLEKGVTTRSRSARPAPASVKRQRVDRNAKQKAQEKINFTFVPCSGNDTRQSPGKEESIAVKPGKRLRSSDASQNSQNRLETVSDNKSKKRHVESLRNDESNKCAQSSPSRSRSITPTMDENRQPDTVKSPRGSFHPEQRTDTSQTKDSKNENVTDTSEASSQAQVVDTDLHAASPDSSSDSGESQFSHVSEVPLIKRLERIERKKRRRMEGKSLDYLLKKRRKNRGPLLNVGEGTTSSSVRKFIVPKAKELVKRCRAEEKQRAIKEREQDATKTHLELPNTKNSDKTDLNEPDDEVQMIEEVPGKTMSKSVSKGVDSNNSKDDRKKPQEGTIRISFNKAITNPSLQRSLSSSSASPRGTPASQIVDESKKKLLTKSTSLPTTSSTETPLAADREVDLEDSNRWENPDISSPRKAPKMSMEPFHVNLLVPSTSTSSLSNSQSSSLAASNNQSSSEPLNHEIRRSESSPPRNDNLPTAGKDAAQSSTPSKESSNETAQPSRALRVRKSTFDPKMEATKIIPKSVPKVTKESLQQNISSPAQSKKSESLQVNDGENCSSKDKLRNSSSDAAEVESTFTQNKSQSKSHQQNEPEVIEDDDVQELMPQKEQERSQSSQQSPCKAASSNADSVMSVKTPPRQQLQKSQAPSPHKAKPEERIIALDGGVFRSLPKPSSESSRGGDSSRNDTSDRASSLRGGTWRRGSSEIRREAAPSVDDTTVDFESPPDDDEGRRRNNSRNSRRPSRSRGGGGGGGYRGRGSHHRGGQQQFDNYSTSFGSPYNTFYGEGPRGRGAPRPPFRGGPPPRASTINTLTSRGRYHQQGHYGEEEPHRISFFPRPSLMDLQFNPQFTPPLMTHPEMGPPSVGPSQFFPGNQVIMSPAEQIPPGNFESFSPPLQQSFQSPFFY